jgi:phosphate transport system protein
MGKEREEIRGLMESLVAMADEVGVMLSSAMDAFGKNPSRTVEELTEKDKTIDRMENLHDSRCLRILALYQPEADDLRTVFMALKINNDLERIGDHALNIAERAETLSKPLLPVLRDRLDRMGILARGMLSDAITAFVARDSALAKSITTRDDEADNYLRATIQDVLLQEGRDEPFLETGIAVVLAAKELERIADLCTNIAEDVVFMAEGVTIKHSGEI